MLSAELSRKDDSDKHSELLLLAGCCCKYFARVPSSPTRKVLSVTAILQVGETKAQGGSITYTKLCQWVGGLEDTG